MHTNPSPYFAESFIARAASGLPSSVASRRLGVKASQLKAWEEGRSEPPAEALEALRDLAAARGARDGAGSFRFVDLFAGIGGMRRAFEGAGGECVFTSEWNRMALETYLANHGGGHPVAGDITKVDAADIPDHEVLVAGFPCFPEGTYIETDGLNVPIEQVKVGDLVPTHMGRLRPVAAVMSRDGAELHEVKVTGMPSFMTTDEHPFFVRRRRRVWDNAERRYVHEFSEPVWVEAKNLDGDCFAALPMDVPGEGDGRSGPFWYLVGRYLGGGWVSDMVRTEKGREGERTKGVIICTSHEDGDDLMKRVEQAGFHPVPSVEDTVTEIHICSAELADFLKGFGKEAEGKQVPRWVMSLPRETLAALWQGWLDADGHRVKHGHEKYEATTVSRALAISMSRVARNAFGRVACVRGSRVAPTTKIGGRTVSQRTQYKVALSSMNGGKTFIKDGFAWVKVKSVKATGEKARVFNIEVEEDNSYVAEGVVVHNCQPFSIAGVSKKNSLGRPHGFADETQGTLFFDVARILDEKRPAAFLLENVRNLASHDGGRTFDVILRTLRDDLGYSVSWKLMDASLWVPQKRVRIAIVGFRDGGEFDFSDVRLPASGPKLDAVLHVEGEPGSDGCPYAPGGVPDPRYTLSEGLWSFLQGYAVKHAAKGNGFGCSVVGPEDVARTMSARYYKDGSEILVRQDGPRPRKLTPRECARLMGFETREGPRMAIPVSDTQAYKQFGNSVAVPCFQAVAEAMALRLGPDSAMAAAA